jgi:hypothetical protein
LAVIRAAQHFAIPEPSSCGVLKQASEHGCFNICFSVLIHFFVLLKFNVSHRPALHGNRIAPVPVEFCDAHHPGFR